MRAGMVGIGMAIALYTAGAHAFAAELCPLPGERPMAVAQLFFGRSVPGRLEVTDREWRQFAAKILSRFFRNGFTDYDGVGQWRNPKTGAIEREKSKVVLVVAPDDAEFHQAILAVSSAYRGQFRQRSVGVVTSGACAAF